MKSTLTQRVLPTFLLALGLAQPVAAALPGSGCSLATLQGSYSWDETTRTDYSPYGYSLFGAGWVHAVSVGREVNDGNGVITAGQMTINNTYNGVETLRYTGVVTVRPNCTGTYYITLADGSSGGGGSIYVDPLSGNFTLLDEFNIGTAQFVRDGSSGGLSSPFPNISWP